MTPNAWLASHLFRVHPGGALWSGPGRVILPLKPTLQYDAHAFRSGDLLSSEDQAQAVREWLTGSNPWGVEDQA